MSQIVWQVASNSNNEEKTSRPPKNVAPKEVILPEGAGKDEVEAYCAACHSLHIVNQQKGLTRERWEELIEWMVEEQGMEALDTEDYKLVLDYLTTHLGPKG